MGISNELDEIIKNESITTVFQAIVSLKDGNIIGYEALSRGPKNSLLHNPEKLFVAAQDCNRLWDLECLCRSKAIEGAHSLDKNKHLFINVDPFIFKDEKYKRGFTKEFLAKHNMSPETIIFEITERTCIKDYKSFMLALENYLEEGYKIAIDDTGAGYSGLKMLSKTKPHYIKMDMELIRNIHEDSFKQHLISGIVQLANNENMTLIAEGIEKEEELIKLIQLGVHAGQGYFLQRPMSSLININKDISSSIKTSYKKYNNIFAGYSQHCIGEIARMDKSFSSDVPCRIIKEHFDNTTYTGACIVDKDNVPVGLIMNHSLNDVLATRYGLSVFLKRPVSLVMDKYALILDYNTPVSDVSNIAMERKDKNLYDYIIVTKSSKYYGIVTIKSLLQFTTTLERNFAKELNPLTGLPGNAIIENKLKDILSYENDCCLLYIDIDNFKIYNDMYGFENGDEIIKFTAQTINNNVKVSAPYSSFVGHIGGDDFIVVIEECYNKCEELCRNIINQFDKGIIKFLNETDIKNGFIEASDRRGNKDIFDLTSISIAGIYGKMRIFSNDNDLAKYVASIKKKVKNLRHSNYKVKTLELTK